MSRLKLIIKTTYQIECIAQAGRSVWNTSDPIRPNTSYAITGVFKWTTLLRKVQGHEESISTSNAHPDRTVSLTEISLALCFQDHFSAITV